MNKIRHIDFINQFRCKNVQWSIANCCLKDYCNSANLLATNIKGYENWVLQNFEIARILGLWFFNCVFCTVIIKVFWPKGMNFAANSGTKPGVMPKSRSSTANSGTKVAVLLGINRFGSFPLHSAPHSLFSIWIDLKRFQGHQRGGEETGFD